MKRVTTKPNNIRQIDLAALFNVSRVTVSRALRQTGEVESKLEAAILAAARKQGYSDEAQFHARALRQRRGGPRMATRVICAIIRDAASIGKSLFHLQILNGVERASRESGNELLVVSGASSAGADGAFLLPRVVTRRQVDGVIWLLSEIDLKYLQSPCPVPLVTLLFALPGVDVVNVNDHGAMRAMGEYLVRQGHRRVAFVGPDSELTLARLGGLRDGLAAAGGRVNDGDVQMKRFAMLPDTVVPLVRAIMERRKTVKVSDRCTAIAVYNDYMAVTVIRCLQDEYGLRVPQDMSVTGFDNIEAVPAGMPKLTTATLPLEDLGAEAVRLISWRMQNPPAPVRRVTLPAPFVEGASVGRANPKP